MNVYTYTNSQTAEGAWSTTATPAPMASGKVNACNGEILVLPAKRNSDGKQVYVALQSVPMNSSRQYVGFYYKELADASDFITGTAMAANWQTGLRVSETTSCYSTMVMMDNDSIAFVYEENSYNGGYDIVFKSLSLDTITAGLYSYDKTFTDRSSYFLSSLYERIPNIESEGYIVGEVSDICEFLDALFNFEDNPTQEDMESLWAMYQSGLPTVPLLANRPYRLRNAKQYTEGAIRYMSIDDNTMTTTNSKEMLMDELFVFQPSTIDGQYYVYSPQRGRYIGRTGANETKLTYVTSTALAGRYTVNSNTSGISTLVCNNATGTNSALHCATDGRLVPWTTTAEASGWYIEPVEEWELTLNNYNGFTAKAICMPFSFSTNLKKKASSDAKVFVVTLADGKAAIDWSTDLGEGIPAATPVMIFDRMGVEKVTLTIPDVPFTEAVSANNDLKGTLLPVSNLSSQTDEAYKNVCILGYKNSEIGFYPAATINTLPANTAYICGEDDAQGYPLKYSEMPTGIQSPSSADSLRTSLTYDLQGRRINVQPSKGVFIINGRKVVK